MLGGTAAESAEPTGASTMTSKEDSHTTRSLETRPSEVEVAQLLKEAEQQYEECMRLADLADVRRPTRSASPDTPGTILWGLWWTDKRMPSWSDLQDELNGIEPENEATI